MEIWAEIENYEGLYEVSNYGNIRSTPCWGNHFKGRILKNCISHRGRPQVCLHKKGKGHVVHVHRLVAKAFIPNHKNLPQVNHIDGDKTNNNCQNLEWTDNSGNQKHAYRLGLNKIREGENATHRKLTKEQVVKIRGMAKECNLSELGRLYNVYPSTIARVISYKSWKNI